MDGSGLVPHSSAWLAFWQRQVRLYETGQKHVSPTLDGVRAVMQATPDDGWEADLPEEESVPASSQRSLERWQ
jgi:hypothetical protein